MDPRTYLKELYQAAKAWYKETIVGFNEGYTTADRLLALDNEAAQAGLVWIASDTHERDLEARLAEHRPFTDPTGSGKADRLNTILRSLQTTSREWLPESTTFRLGIHTRSNEELNTQMILRYVDQHN